MAGVAQRFQVVQFFIEQLVSLVVEFKPLKGSAFFANPRS